MDTPDLVTPLTTAEKAFVDTINMIWTRAQVLERLKADLQTVLEIERATISIYLYPCYSLVRSIKYRDRPFTVYECHRIGAFRQSRSRARLGNGREGI